MACLLMAGYDINAGNQERHEKASNLYALAVSPNNVAAAPEAQTYALTLAGLGLIGWRARLG
jgi:hypothetical protein